MRFDLKKLIASLRAHVEGLAVAGFSSIVLLIISLGAKNWVHSTTDDYLTEAAKKPEFVEKVISSLDKNIFGQSYPAYFFMGRKGDPQEYHIPIYSSEGQEVTLYIKAQHFGTGQRRKIQILVDGKPVNDVNIASFEDYKMVIQLTEQIKDARTRSEHDFSKNMQTITFRTDPFQKTSNYVSVEALIMTIGIPRLQTRGDGK